MNSLILKIDYDEMMKKFNPIKSSDGLRCCTVIGNSEAPVALDQAVGLAYSVSSLGRIHHQNRGKNQYQDTPLLYQNGPL